MKTAFLLLALILQSTRLWAAGFETGVCTHMKSIEEVELMARAGLTSFRTDLYWGQVETERGFFQIPKYYDDYIKAARRKGLQPLLILCYGNKFYDHGDYPRSREARAAYARFCQFAAKHFRGRVKYFEVWNEWNWGTGMEGRGPGDPESYVRLLKDTYRAIKAVDRKLVVIGGDMSNTGLRNDWLPKACAAGLLDHLDALSFHPYCWGAEGWERTPRGGVITRIDAVAECVNQYPRGAGIPFYLTEVGWPNHTAGISEQQSAKFLKETFALVAAEPRVKGLWWYALRDDGTNPESAEDLFGTVRKDLTPKPAYTALSEATAIATKARTRRPLFKPDYPPTR